MSKKWGDTQPGLEEYGCNIDTGIPMAIIACMILDGRIKERGVFSPEFLVPPESFFEDLAEYKIHVFQNGKKIN